MRPHKRRRGCPRATLGLAALFASAVALSAAPAAAAPPAVTATAATEVGIGTARGHGAVDPEGEETFYHFDYIADALFKRNQAGGKDPFLGASSDGFGRIDAQAGGTPVTSLLGESVALLGATEYHLRLVAENESGAQVAVAPNFVTLGPPPTPIPCFGDSCQILPPEPREPALGTLVPGLGNPKVHYAHRGRKSKRPRRKGSHKDRDRGQEKKKGGRERIPRALR